MSTHEEVYVGPYIEITYVPKPGMEMDWFDLLEENDLADKNYDEELYYHADGITPDNKIILSDFSYEEYGITEMTPNTIPEKITKFKEEFKNLIADIKPLVTSFEIKFGIIVYYN